MRTFVAITIPEHPALNRASETFGALGGSVKAVDPRNMHLTLKFIGETSLPIPDLLMSLETASAGHAPFALHPTTAGAFPNWSRPSVVWIGFGDGERAAELSRSIDMVLNESFSIEPEKRPFSPHLTLARIRGPARVNELRRAAESACDSIVSDHYSIPVASITLMISTLTPKGPIYEEAGRVPLRG